MDKIETLVIGAGIVGLAIGAELSQSQNVLVTASPDHNAMLVTAAGHPSPRKLWYGAKSSAMSPTKQKLVNADKIAS